MRLFLVVVLLGTSLTFTAAMVALNSGANNQVAKANAVTGTAVTVSPPNSFGPFVNGVITSKQVAKAKAEAHVIGVTETVQQRYTGSNLYGTAKLQSPFQQGGFRRVTLPPGAGSSGFGPPGARQSGSSRQGFKRFIFNAGKGGTSEPTITGITGAGAGMTLTGGTVKIRSGRDLTSSDANAKVALMSKQIARANKLKVGSTFKLAGTNVQLVGEYTTGNTSFASNSILVPIKLAETVFKLKGITGLTVYADSAKDVNAVASELRTSLGSGATVTTQASEYQSALSALQGTKNNIQAALIASMVAAALVIAFAIFIIVRERVKEIAVLKAIGASSTNIVTQFVCEALGMTLGAGVMGAVLLEAFGGQIAQQFDASTPSAATPGSFFRATNGGTGRPFGGFGGSFTPTGGFNQFVNQIPGVTNQPLSAGLTTTTILVLLAAAATLAVVASWIPAWYVSRLRPARVLSHA